MPHDKWETAKWLAEYFIERDLAEYKKSHPKSASTEYFVKEACHIHRMRPDSQEDLFWRLSRKLYHRKKSQLYATYFRIRADN